MHAVARFYSGPGAKELFELLAEKKDDVEAKIRAVPGFVAYTLIRTDEGGTSITVCRDKAGTDASIAVARQWIEDNAPNLKVSPPGVSEGEAILQLS